VDPACAERAAEKVSLRTRQHREVGQFLRIVSAPTGAIPSECYLTRGHFTHDDSSKHPNRINPSSAQS
jgi:hypothetical protein